MNSNRRFPPSWSVVKDRGVALVRSVGMGDVDSPARPGSNMTGFMSYDPSLYTKQCNSLPRLSLQAPHFDSETMPDRSDCDS